MADFAVVAMTYRTANARLRALAQQLDDDPLGPSKRLLAAGYANGIVRVDTCSRVEWIISAMDGKWAADLLRAAFATAAPELDARSMFGRTGNAAVRHVFRTACGLDSVAEGEAAVAKQLLDGFARAHAAGTTDKALQRLWNHTTRLVHGKRQLLPNPAAFGVEALACARLPLPALAGTVHLLGRGQIGTAIARRLQTLGYTGAVYGRAELPALQRHAQHAMAVVVATGAPEAWFELPPRAPGPVAPIVIDVGSPQQVLAAPGWAQITLDTLLNEDGTVLSHDTRQALETLCALHVDAFAEVSSKRHELLGHIERKKRSWLEDRLPKLLARIDDSNLSREIRREFLAYTHALVKDARSDE